MSDSLKHHVEEARAEGFVLFCRKGVPGWEDGYLTVGLAGGIVFAVDEREEGGALPGSAPLSDRALLAMAPDVLPKAKAMARFLQLVDQARLFRESMRGLAFGSGLVL